MGYRSEVAIAVKEEYAKKFKEVLVESTFLEYADVLHETADGVDGISFSGIKWYDTIYPEVQMIMAFLEELDDEHYGFVEIGEDYDDVKTDGSPWDFGLEIHRDIYIPFEDTRFEDTKEEEA